MAKLTELEVKFLRCAAGEVVTGLPWNDRAAMSNAERRLRSLGFVESGYDEDQPTSWATPAGRAALAALATPQPVSLPAGVDTSHEN